MILSVGNKVVYPTQGPCLIDHLTKRVIGGKTIVFYRLVVLDDQGGELFIPIDKVKEIGFRQLLPRTEIPRLLRHLKTAKARDEDWRQRAIENSRRFASGSAFDIAKIIGTLTERRKIKALSLAESRILEKARRLLICEVSEVMGSTRLAAEEQIDQALKVRDGLPGSHKEGWADPRNQH